MFGFLALGFLMGMRHALEADHLAAVGALSLQAKHEPNRPSRKLALLGISWGLGHTLTLMALCGFVMLAGQNLPPRLSALFEMAVGAMLIGLGVNVLVKMRRARIHFHSHNHGDGKAHIHAHSHQDLSQDHASDPHEHQHGLSLKAFFIGLLHGAAGSAALLALTAAATQSVWAAFGYVLVFGLGSVLGMGLLSWAVSLPFSRRAFLPERLADKIVALVQIGTACLAMLIGLSMVWTHISMLYV